MTLFKRISASVVSRVDQVVGELENHDAVAQASLEDMRRKVAAARVRLNQVQREARSLDQEIDKQEQQGQRWRARAKETAASDEQKALECVSRARECDRKVDQLRKTCARYRDTSERLAEDMDSSEQRLSEMKQKLTLMRARQATGEALNTTSEAESDVVQQLDDTFDRWEMKLGVLEMAVDHASPVDELEREFRNQENAADLRAELDALLDGEGEK